MLFSSIPFIFYFLPVFLAIYIASGLKISVLLTASVLFYTWGEGLYVLVLGGLIVLNFALVGAFEHCEGSRRKALLVLLLMVDLGVLAVFKYADFVIGNLNALEPGWDIPTPHFALPLGISFFTFQLVSYGADVYQRRTPVERSLAKFATYILMFPHLIAGPIVRYSQVRDELQDIRRNSGKLGLGIQYFIVGLCQKVLIANTLAPVADHAFGLPPATLAASTAWLGMVSYTLQIYFDFCGYSNMAIGLAFMLGFTFPKNFDYPYAAHSMGDFWRRWHMSLSFWFRDYVYIPLGGSRGGEWKTSLNLMLVFFLTGLWHGAAWNFIVWGLFHGTFLLLERMGARNLRAEVPDVLRRCYVLLIVMLGWVLFRAPDLSHAWDYMLALVPGDSSHPTDLELSRLLTPEAFTVLVSGAVLAFPTLPWLLDRLKLERGGRTSWIAEPRLDTASVHRLPIAMLLLGLVLCCALLVSSTLNPFLYFRF